MSTTAALLVFVAGGCMGQFIAAVVTELVRPWISHVVEHRRLAAASRHIGATVQCNLCSVWVNGNPPPRPRS